MPLRGINVCVCCVLSNLSKVSDESFSLKNCHIITIYKLQFDVQPALKSPDIYWSHIQSCC